MPKTEKYFTRKQLWMPLSNEVKYSPMRHLYEKLHRAFRSISKISLNDHPTQRIKHKQKSFIILISYLPPGLI